MADPYIGEIRIFSGNFAPRGWAFCNGQLLPISQNTALYSILGTIYGGNGHTTFALPDLMGKAPMHQGFGSGLTGRDLGETSGSETVTLMTTELPPHTHEVYPGDGLGTTDDPSGAAWGTVRGRRVPVPYTADTSRLVPMNGAAIGATGDSQPHNNMQPYLGMNFIIALEGIFPARG